jgi:DMSO reductase anchor subunit
VKPSASIIFFTVSSGAGLGLLALLAIADLCPVELLPAKAIAAGVFLGLTLVVAGLASSVLHLAKPSNAWRSLSRFRTSWLSREAVFAAALLPIAAV